jgi:hypothetical protein
MHTPYRSHDHFLQKAALLENELGLDRQGALEALAHISGYDNQSSIAENPSGPDTGLLWSREELMARLLALYPDLSNESAGAVITKLDLPVRETDMRRFAQSPDAAPNIGG